MVKKYFKGINNFMPRKPNKKNKDKDNEEEKDVCQILDFNEFLNIYPNQLNSSCFL